MDRVGYMGIPGSFSEIAAEELVKQCRLAGAELEPLVCAKNILYALRDGSVTYGVLGVRNSTAGPVSEFVQNFEGVNYEKLGEYILPIHHCLFKKPGTALEKLREVATHPQALKQTEHTRKARWPQLAERSIEDTAIGAEWLAKGILPETSAVICSINAGKSWGLDLIAENIEDSATNQTTFWLLRLV